MALMAAPSTLSCRCLDSVFLYPHSPRAGNSSVCRVPHRVSTRSTTGIALPCRTAPINGDRSRIGASCSLTFGARLQESVKKTIGENPVVIYSKTRCSYSLEVKSLFKRLGVEPLVIELDQLGPQGPQLQKTLQRLTGQHTVPNVFIGGKHIGGCTAFKRDGHSIYIWDNFTDTHEISHNYTNLPSSLRKYCKATPKRGTKACAIGSLCKEIRELVPGDATSAELVAVFKSFSYS